MLPKHFFILLYILSCFLCIFTLAKYSFDDYVMKNWMNRKNYILSDLFTLYVACLPIVNMVIILGMAIYEVTKILLVFHPYTRDNFQTAVYNIFMKHMDHFGRNVYYPLVVIIGTTIWFVGLTDLKAPIQFLLWMFPGTSWAMFIDSFF